MDYFDSYEVRDMLGLVNLLRFHNELDENNKHPDNSDIVINSLSTRDENSRICKQRRS